jgi:hypothetical protein
VCGTKMRPPWRCLCGNVALYPRGPSGGGDDSDGAGEGAEGAFVAAGVGGVGPVRACAAWVEGSAAQARQPCDGGTGAAVTDQLLALVASMAPHSIRAQRFAEAGCAAAGPDPGGGRGEGEGLPVLPPALFFSNPVAVSARCAALMHRSTISSPTLSQLTPHLVVQRLQCLNCEADLGVELGWQSQHDLQPPPVAALDADVLTLPSPALEGDTWAPAPGPWAVLLSTACTTPVPLLHLGQRGLLEGRSAAPHSTQGAGAPSAGVAAGSALDSPDGPSGVVFSEAFGFLVWEPAAATHAPSGPRDDSRGAGASASAGGLPTPAATWAEVR